MHCLCLRTYSRFLPRVKSISAQPYLVAAPSGLSRTAQQAVFLRAIEQRSNQQSHIKSFQSLLMKLQLDLCEQATKINNELFEVINDISDGSGGLL